MTSLLLFCVALCFTSPHLNVAGQRIFFPNEEIILSPHVDFDCGIAPLNSRYLKQASMDVFHNGEQTSHLDRPLYYMNKTAEKLEEQGYTILDEEVILEDVLCNFTYTNSTYSGSYSCHNVLSPTGDFINQRDVENLFFRIFGVGGEPADIKKSYFMAQLGKRNGEEITWLCDGVLVNREWILSAAHCFVNPRAVPNFLRLGDHNLTSSSDNQSMADKIVFDFPFAQVVPHPDFKVSERYHDLVLIRIPRKIPKYSTNIHPICLPWAQHSDFDLVGKSVTLIGWGATQFGGPKTETLQEVHLKVFETSFCDRSYQDLPKSKLLYPRGLKEDTILCVGWEEGGRDACGGDSGAPLIHEASKTKNLVTSDVDMLAGVVSGGFGCGLREFPGLYMPINKPKYLRWIKDVAFNN